MDPFFYPNVNLLLRNLGQDISPNSFVTKIAQKEATFIFGITKKLKLQFSIQKCSCLILNFGGKVGIQMRKEFLAPDLSE
jgi:hypothetical protein